MRNGNLGCYDALCCLSKIADAGEEHQKQDMLHCADGEEDDTNDNVPSLERSEDSVFLT